MARKHGSYVHGTAAEKLQRGAVPEKIQYDVYKENKVLKEKKKYKTNSAVKLKVVFICLMAFGACFLLMYRYAIITEMNNDIIEINREYNRVKNENSILRVKIENELDIDKIRQAAESRLDMQKPDRSQIVYLNIPRNDATVVLDDRVNATQNTGSFAAFADRIGKFLKLLY